MTCKTLYAVLGTLLLNVAHGEPLSFSPSICINRTLIDVKSFISNQADTPCFQNNNVTICKTFQSIFISKININDSCIRIFENQLLSGNILVEHAKNVVILKDDSAKVISFNCQLTYDLLKSSNGTGFTIVNSSNINFYDITIENCGQQHHIDIDIDCFFSSLAIHTSFYFETVSNVTFEKVVIVKSYGYSIYMINTGSFITFNGVCISNNLIVPFKNSFGQTESGFASGGGIYITYTGTAFSNNNTILVKGGSNFFNNIAELKERDLDCNGQDYDLPFGRGGAFAVSFNGDSRNNKVQILGHTSFSSNNAMWGAGVNIKFTDNSHHNSVLMKDVFFLKNNATKFGGGIYIVSLDSSYQNKFKISDTPIHENVAEIGGGLAIVGLATGSASIHLCDFYENSALFGSAIFARDIKNLCFHDILAHNNNFLWRKQAIAHGAIATFSSIISIYGNKNEIYKNKNTGLLLDQSTLRVYGNLTITGNTGHDGGGISMFDNSQIFLYHKAIMTCKANTAFNRGGAIYIDIPGPKIQPLDNPELNRYECFFQMRAGEAIFINNKAIVKGDSIYASTLQYCHDGDKMSFKNILTNWSNFQFTPRDNINHVVTDVKDISLLNADEWVPAPGLSMPYAINLTDERGTYIDGSVDIYAYRSNETTRSSRSTFLVQNNNTYIKFDGNLSNEFNVSISVPYSEVLPRTLFNVKMQPCPVGFRLEKKNCVCDKKNNFLLGIVQCEDSKVFISNGQWIPFNHANRSFQCPAGYCKRRCDTEDTITGFECRLDIRKQCDNTRDQQSFLCSKCLSGYSILLNNTCADCRNIRHYGMIWVPLLMLSMNLLVCIMLLILNNNTYAVYLNSFFFFYKCCNIVIHTSDDVVNLLRDAQNIVEVTNVWFVPLYGFHYCLIDKLNNLTKLYLEFSSPMIYPFNLIILYLMVRKQFYPRCMTTYFTSDALQRTFNIMSFIFWYEMIYVAFKTLKYIKFGEEIRPFVYAAVIYGSKQHFPLMVIAILVISLFLFNLIFMILSSTLLEKKMRASCFRLVPYYNSFKVGLITSKDETGEVNRRNIHKDRTLFSIYYLVTHAIVVAISLYTTPNIRATVLSVVFLLLVYVLLWLKPYESAFVNCFDLLNMSMLALATMLISSLQGLYCPPDNLPSQCELLATTITVFVFLPALCLFFYFMYLYLPCIQTVVRERYSSNNDIEDIEEHMFPYRLLDDNEDD